MIHRYRIVGAVLTIIAAFIFFVSSIVLREPVINTVLVTYGETTSSVEFPHYTHDSLADTMTYTFNYVRDQEKSDWLTIIPDDLLYSMKVNGTPILLDSIPRAQLRDYKNGARIALADHLKMGSNAIEVVVSNRGGRGGLDLGYNPPIDQYKHSALLLFLGVLCFLGTCGILLLPVWQTIGRKKSLNVVAGIIILGITCIVSGNQLTNIYSNYNGKHVEEQWPIHKHSVKGRYVLTFDYSTSLWSSDLFKIIPDDKLIEMRVNGDAVDLSQVDDAELKDWHNGFMYDFTPYLTQEINSIEIIVTNQGGQGGVTVFPNNGIFERIVIFTLYCLGLFLLMYGAFSYFTFSKSEMVLFGLGIALLIWYLIYTPLTVRIFDVYEGGGHRDYIFYLIDNLGFPHPAKGWEYHQPPLYYLFGAVVAFISTHLFAIDWHVPMRFASLLMLVVFQFVAYLTVRELIKSRLLRRVLLGLILFWPSGIIHSIRIGNDMPMYLFTGIGFYLIVRWWRTHRMVYFNWSLVCLFLSMVSKSSGVILGGVLAGLLLIQLIRKNRKQFIKPALLSFVVVIIAAGVNIGDNIYFAQQEKSDWLLLNVGTSINKRLKVDNGIVNYIYLDIPTYLQQPFTSTWHDWGGRQYFWNFFLKSSLFSEYQFRSSFHAVLGGTIGVLLLLMILMPFIGIRRLSLARIYKEAPALLLVLSSVGALLAYRIKAPVSCNTDFRYIYPVLIGAILLYGRMVQLIPEGALKKSKIRMILIGIPILFSFCSLLFFVTWGFVQ
ncbi:MAG: glycosyltransferase family 39 protein [Fibrobacterales bacterium]